MVKRTQLSQHFRQNVAATLKKAGIPYSREIATIPATAHDSHRLHQLGGAAALGFRSGSSVGAEPGKERRLEVTGILLYKEGDIMQLIEGPDEAVRNLVKTIYADSRHQGIIQLLKRKIVVREFPDWSMEFHELSLWKVEQLAQLLEDEESLTQAGRLSPALRLLTSFGWRP